MYVMNVMYVFYVRQRNAMQCIAMQCNVMYECNVLMYCNVRYVLYLL